jgi:hypothetical protein
MVRKCSINGSGLSYMAGVLGRRTQLIRPNTSQGIKKTTTIRNPATFFISNRMVS